MEEENGKEKRKPLTFSEKARNILIGLGAASGLILGLVSNCKGEPVAEKTWTTLRAQVNEISVAVNKLSRRVVFLQAHEAGRTAATVQLKLEALQKENDVLRASLEARKAPPKGGAAIAEPCAEGHIRMGTQCQRVPAAVAKRVKDNEAEFRKRLEEEKLKRLELERRKQQLMQQLQHPPAPKPPEDLKKLPLKLDEAAK